MPDIMATDICDLLILMDITASIGAYRQALNDSLPVIIGISALTGCFSRIGVVACRNYCGDDLTEWSGWYSITEPEVGTTSKENLLDFVKGIHPKYGGGWPEATKTGLTKAYQNMRADTKTVMLLYADDPPPTPATGGNNQASKRLELNTSGKYGSDGPKSVDWISATNALREGDKRAQVFNIVQSRLADTITHYTYLATRTNGVCLRIPSPDSNVITTLTLEILLVWLGVEREVVKPSTHTLAQVYRYKNADNIGQIKAESDDISRKYWVKEDTEPLVKLVKDNLDQTPITLDTLKHYVPARQLPMKNLSQWYKEDETYRKLVVGHLRDIIKSDVAVVTANPVFGSLWRSVCNDRLNVARDELIQLIGEKVEVISDITQRAKVKAWLEESYDFIGDIQEIIQSVSAEDRFPCVFLDPTVNFHNLYPSAFTRDELLEIGRSCSGRVLRRLGRVLTQLTFVTAEDEMPAHIKYAPDDTVTRIPLALVKTKYKRKFWGILLHAFLPGTTLSPRPAALLAALSLRMGIAPLRDVADVELLNWSGKWNTLDIPETWNIDCLTLILAADRDYEDRITRGVATRPAPGAAFLADDDRRLFGALVDYKTLEMKLNTTLTAQIGWHPDKSKVAVGPTVTCRVCNFPRSVTIMGTGGVCGLCAEESWFGIDAEERKARLQANVGKDDDEKTQIAWVECCVTACRAQYVVYNPDKLRFSAKCRYCRISGRATDDMTTPSTAPFVECKLCLSRVIWPESYRETATGSSEFNPEDFTCPACVNGVPTIVKEQTTVSKLAVWNGQGWLLRNDDEKIAKPFSNRTVFHTISTAGTNDFADKVEVLPGLASPPSLNIRGKLVRNPSVLLSELQRWIDWRAAQADECMYCFWRTSKTHTKPPCGRSDCSPVCRGCRHHWYGKNMRGRIINIAALHCPLCRRWPAPETVAAEGLRYPDDLRRAIDDAGQWVYAWCWDCGFAKRLAKRVCAQGMPTAVSSWRCEDCQKTEAKRVVIPTYSEYSTLTESPSKNSHTKHKELKCNIL
jgi:hypothetical protein